MSKLSFSSKMSDNEDTLPVLRDSEILATICTIYLHFIFLNMISISVATLIIYQILSKQDKHRIVWILLALLPAVIISNSVEDIMKNIFAIQRPCVGLEYCPSDLLFTKWSYSCSICFCYYS